MIVPGELNRIIKSTARRIMQITEIIMDEVFHLGIDSLSSSLINEIIFSEVKRVTVHVLDIRDFNHLQFEMHVLNQPHSPSVRLT